MSTVVIVSDGQYGSCGKGAYCGVLGRLRRPALAMRNGGPNAGHSVRWRGRDGLEVYALRHIPAAAITSPGTILALPGAALINPKVLHQEIDDLESKGVRVKHRLKISPIATVITHADEEAELESDLKDRIGSTREGVGAAQARKVRRTATVARDVDSLAPYLADVQQIVEETLQIGGEIHIETTQGVGLGLHYGHYPYATSRDITPGQAMSDCGISPTDRRVGIEMHLLSRTFPIRVAGNSGPMGGEEITWEQLSEETGGYVKPERTTVTKLVRRVARFDKEEMLKSCRLVQPTCGILTFGDYVLPELGRKFEEAYRDGVMDMILNDDGNGNARVSEERVDRIRGLQEEMRREWNQGAFDEYRLPYKLVGTDIVAVSMGFGLIVPVSDAASAFLMGH